MKMIQKIGIIILIPLVAFLIWGIAILVDSENDTSVCKEEFRNVMGQANLGMWQFDSAFANDDFNRMNLGKNINCTVFWEGWKGEVIGNGYLASVDFISGNLTKETVAKGIYW